MFFIHILSGYIGIIEKLYPGYSLSILDDSFMDERYSLALKCKVMKKNYMLPRFKKYLFETLLI